MSYFINRPRAYSKPTKEETKEFSNLLSKCSAHRLRSIMLSAANDSPAVMHSFIKIMEDANLSTQSHLQSVQSNQQHSICRPCYPNTGLLTPVDLWEDSEMSGTENMQPLPHHHQQLPPSELSMTTPSHFTFTDQSPHNDTTSPKRPNKRKSLSDRDDDIPLQIPPSPLSKRHKPTSHHPSNPQPTPEKTYCLNCGLWTQTSRFENLHGCIYHPGDFKLDGTVCSWSCCRNSDLKSRGCLVTRHKGLLRDMWVRGSDQRSNLFYGDGQVTVDDDHDHDHSQMSQYARIVSIKG